MRKSIHYYYFIPRGSFAYKKNGYLRRARISFLHVFIFFFTGSQELHVAQPVNPAFNKFNSLDRRALNKRQNSGGGGLLKLVTPTSGPESLPIVGRLTGAILNQFDRGNKEPERRHSSYDSSTNR